jgi:hypothetical protein
MTTKTEAERVEFLKGLGLNPDSTTPPPVEAPIHKPATGDVVLAPPGTDPRLQPVDEIAFDPRLLDKFPSLDGDGLRAASDYVFSLYKSYGRDKVRNPALHRRITSFITATRRSRQTGGMVTEHIKTTKEQRDTAVVLAASEYGPGEVAEAIRIREALRAAGIDPATLLKQD